MQLTQSKFGSFQNEDVTLFSLQNDKGMTVKLCDYGATVTAITIPGNNGDEVNLACGFDTFDSYFTKKYLDNAPYFGSTVGRYASQIKDAKFSLNGQDYHLAANCGSNNLHGGVKGFDKQLWDARPIKTPDSVGVVFLLKSPDLQEGFPGNVEVSVAIHLNNSNEIKIDYMASTDKDTPLSMTNHTYFNLSGFSETVENHLVNVLTNKKLELDETGAATGKIIDVSKQADDLRTVKKVAEVQAALGDGFEHFFVFDNKHNDLEKVAQISHPTNGRSLEVFTSEPCMLFYTGKYTSDELRRENGDKFGKFRGFCCETHRFPNGPNIPESPGSITKKGETFSSSTVFKLSW